METVHHEELLVMSSLQFATSAETPVSLTEVLLTLTLLSPVQFSASNKAPLSVTLLQKDRSMLASPVQLAARVETPKLLTS